VTGGYGDGNDVKVRRQKRNGHCSPKLLGRMEAWEFWYKSPNCPHTQPSKLQKARFWHFIKQTPKSKLLPVY
jgi:hypothetical protein